MRDTGLTSIGNPTLSRHRGVMATRVATGGLVVTVAACAGAVAARSFDHLVQSSIALVGTVALAIVATSLPLRRATRLRPGQAIRYNG